MIKMKKILSRKYKICTGVFLGLLAVLTIYFFLPVKPFHNTELVNIIIPKNSSSEEVAKILNQNNLIKSPFIFKAYTRLKGIDGQIKAGEYFLNPGQSLPEIAEILKKGRQDFVKITIPEGYTIFQIADLLNNKGLADKNKFMYEIEYGNFNYPFLKNLPKDERRLEGYLFPDTYYFSTNTSEHAVIDIMLNRFSEKINTLKYTELAWQKGLTLHQALTIASMIEREAKVEKERPLMAGVILNRLKRGMPLQVDATVQYALGGHRSKIYYKDLKINSPYNTYLISGLPPGPIACPGESSLLAVINSTPSDYLYYVAKPDGTHAFSRTLKEHNANKVKYQP